jgi:hypothetical protein
MVTHSSTSRPVQCLCMAERTGCPVLTDLWSYVSLPARCHNTKHQFGAAAIAAFDARQSDDKVRWAVERKQSDQYADDRAYLDSSSHFFGIDTIGSKTESRKVHTEGEQQYTSASLQAASLMPASASTCAFTRYLGIAQWRSRVPMSLTKVNTKTLP